MSVMCRKLNCEAEAHHAPVLLFYALPDTPPATMMVDLALCDVHAKTATLDEIMTDEMFGTITKHCLVAKRTVPIRDLTVLKFMDLNESRSEFSRAKAHQRRRERRGH